MSRDITAIHEAQTRLADEERFVSSVLDVIGALVLVLDAQGRVVRFNGACERLSGYRAAEVSGASSGTCCSRRPRSRTCGPRWPTLQAGDLPQLAREPLADAHG